MAIHHGCLLIVVFLISGVSCNSGSEEASPVNDHPPVMTKTQATMSPGATGTPSASASLPSVTDASATTPEASSGAPNEGGPYRVTWPQALEVATAVNFINAYNDQDLEAALALLTEDVEVGDCNFERGTAELYSGTTEARQWLEGRFAENDQIELGEIFNENPETPTGVAGLVIANRSSDTLSRLGYPDGVARGTPKVIFSDDHTQITFFMSGSIGPNSKCDLTHK